MKLTAEEEAMASGAYGEGVRWSMRFHSAVGAFFGAERLVEISTAHMMGDTEVLGAAGIEHLSRLAAGGAAVSVPSTTNARCVDLHNPDVLEQSQDLIASETGVVSSLRAMGFGLTDTCINYQSVYQPSFGEHLAWGDTGTVIYANSVVGARSNFESGPSALAAALTGRVPEYGFHIDRNRRPTLVVDVDAVPGDLADWGAIGGLVGEFAKGYHEVPLFRMDTQPRGDELKHLGASLASYGSMALFHIDGVTPEASAYRRIRPSNDVRHLRIGEADLAQFYDRFPKSGPADVVVLSGPQLSILELKDVAERLHGSRVSDTTCLIITTNIQNLAAAAELGYLDMLLAAGATVVTGTCFYLMGLNQLREQNGWRNVITNSAKVANIVGGYRLIPVLKHTDACLSSAITGRI